MKIGDDPAFDQAMSEFMHFLHLTWPVQLVGYPVNVSKFLMDRPYATVINGVVGPRLVTGPPEVITTWQEAFDRSGAWLSAQKERIIVWRTRPTGEARLEGLFVRMRLHMMTEMELKRFL